MASLDVLVSVSTGTFVNTGSKPLLLVGTGSLVDLSGTSCDVGSTEFVTEFILFSEFLRILSIRSFLAASLATAESAMLSK